MAAPTEREKPTRPAPLLKTFKHKLEKEWTKKVACQNQCEPNPCSCRREFLDFRRIETWMKRHDTNEGIKNADILLAELFDRVTHRTFQWRESQWILSGDDSCVRVFCLLLRRNRGELIEFFREARLVDRHLHLSVASHMESLRAILKHKHNASAETVEKIIQEFESERKASCPAEFELGSTSYFEGGHYILPFCRFNRVNTKGGTASVFEACIQSDLIGDQPLKAALEKSRYTDPEFGECYKVAIKSYSEKHKDIYDWEKEAFEGLHIDENTPIVRYLCSYSHDHVAIAGTSYELQRSYNIMLEYGDMDLDEYCIDPNNVAPVRFEEILGFWRSLFKVAEAIKTVHRVRIQSGKTWKHYCGWHADVKPDNILLVHGDFKLADFGFAKFARTDDSDTVPQEIMRGGTDTYGAPEFARAKRSETLTTVTQKIDTWSYGCVLSVAATWIVLGLQGVLQFQELRKLASRDKKSDKFHDGSDVLPEIKLWHNYLRSHIRIADTVTPRVLDLVENHMLKRHATDRYTSAKLCSELSALPEAANVLLKEKLSESLIIKVDDVVKRALLEVEKKAAIRINNASIQTGITARVDTPTQSYVGRIPPASLNISSIIHPHQSTRIGKAELLQTVQLARTAHRKEILEEELGRPTLTIPESSSQSSHPDNAKIVGERPEFTESPTEHEASDLSSNERWPLPPPRPTPRQPVARDSPYEKAASRSEAILPSPQEPTVIPPTPPSKPSAQFSQRPQREKVAADSFSNHHVVLHDARRVLNSQQNPEPRRSDRRPDLDTSSNTLEAGTSTTVRNIRATINRSPEDGQLSPLSRSPFGPIQPRSSDAIYGSAQSSKSWPVPTPPQSPQSPIQMASPPQLFQVPSVVTPPYDPRYSRTSNAYPYELPSIHAVGKPASETPYSHVTNTYPYELPGIQNPGNLSPELAELSGQSNLDAKSKAYSSHNNQLAHAKGKRVVGDKLTGQSKPDAEQNPYSSHDGQQDRVHGKEVAVDYSAKVGIPSRILHPLPAHVYQLPFHICAIRKALEDALEEAREEQRRAGIRGKLKSLKIGWRSSKSKEETWKGEFYEMLSTYIVDRDMVLVIDNGSTMVDLWPILVFVAETLALQLIGLDEDGIDLKFTISGKNKLDRKELQGESGIRTLKTQLQAARPKTPKDPINAHPTDMLQILNEIFKEYLKPQNPKKTTLIVLTDGLWPGTHPPNKLQDRISQFVKEQLHPRELDDRHFSIGFVRIGSAGKQRLDYLDDQFHKDYDLPDIIDAVSWQGNVKKMLCGSFDGRVDDDGEEGEFEDSQELCSLFEKFNSGELPAQESSLGLTRSATEVSKVSGKSNRFSKILR